MTSWRRDVTGRAGRRTLALVVAAVMLAVIGLVVVTAMISDGARVDRPSPSTPATDDGRRFQPRPLDPGGTRGSDPSTPPTDPPECVPEPGRNCPLDAGGGQSGVR